MRSILRQLFTGRDNQTLDVGRILWFEGVQAFLVISVYSLHKGGSFDPLLWSAGLASILAAGGASIGLKAGAEPVPTALSITTKDGTSFSQRVGKQSSDDDSSSSVGMPQPPANLPGDDDK